jgi:hypothetical protein
MAPREAAPMDASALSAMSALFGSVVGASASLATTWIGQKYSSRQERAREQAHQRELLYAEFISEASRLQIDSFGHQLDSAQAAVKIVAVVNRIRLVATDGVIAAAEQCVDEIIESYFSPNLTLAELHERQPWRKRDPLRDFSEACRLEMNGGGERRLR